MANKDLKNNENILVKVDQNNLIYIDPNSVIVDGEVIPRLVDHENLVMYVNLEADIVPRSTLVSSNDNNTLTSIAKGTFNMLSTKDGGDLNTDWTESYTLKPEVDKKNNLVKKNNSDESGQSFGIESISIIVKGINAIPVVNINFIDVRGKTLFESPENSPYKAFFHVPWPIFYLTVKGFYGKAIRYRLHLVKFNSRYNESNGNFEIQTNFVGSTYAFMADIPLKGMLNAPYMFMKTSEENVKFNENTGLYEKRASKTSKGYSILKSVYSEMKQKKLIPQDFPVKTLREMDVIAKRLNVTLEKIIFDEVVDPRVLNSLKEYGDYLNDLEKSVRSWGVTRLNTQNPRERNGEIYFSLKDKDKNDPKDIIGLNIQGTLEFIVTNYTRILDRTVDTFNTVKKERNNNLNVTLVSPKLNDVNIYIFKFEEGYGVAIEKLVSDIQELKRSFSEQDEKILKEIETRLNKEIKDPSKGFGFEPTVRNLFAVLLANAEVYVRLMKDTHLSAFNVANERKKSIDGLSDEYTKDSAIYPWPEIKKNLSGNQKVIAYPGEKDLQTKLQSNDALLWPEVHFVEEYLNVSTYVNDPLVEKEGGVNDLNIIFESDTDLSNIKGISELFNIDEILPYTNRNFVSFIYELYERAKTLTLFESYNNEVINELVEIEFENIQEILREEIDIISILKNDVKSLNDLNQILSRISLERIPYFNDSIPTTDNISRLYLKPFNITQYNDDKDLKNVDNTLYPQLKRYLTDLYEPEQYRLNIYPFNSNTYLSYIGKNKFDKNELKLHNGVLNVTQKQGFITSPFNKYQWIKEEYSDLDLDNNLFTQKLNYSENFSTNILNTPYFHKQLYSDFIKSKPFGKYVSSSYLLLNSLPYHDLDDLVKLSGSLGDEEGTRLLSGTRMSSLFREIGSTHILPYLLILKWGSIYHRYKKHKLDDEDILNGFITSNNDTTTTSIDYELFFNHNKTEEEFNNYTVGEDVITYTGNTDLGSHPFYDSIYHQIVNNYNHFDVLKGDESFSVNVENNVILYRKRTTNNLNYWTGIVDNSKFDPNDLRYTVLPSDGGNLYIDQTNENNILVNGVDTFDESQEKYFRVIWDDDIIGDTFEGKKFFEPNGYNLTVNKKYSLTDNNKKALDLIGTFSPLILEEFEEIFLEFSSERLNVEIVNSRFKEVTYKNFQDLLKELVSVDKKSTDVSLDRDTLIKTIRNRQKQKLVNLSEELCDYNNFIKLTLGNPKEINPYVFEGFYGPTPGNTLTFRQYNPNQIINYKYVDLYVGENPDDNINYYQEFFEVNNIELSEENVLALRPLIMIYGGYRKNGGSSVKTNFQLYIKNSIFDRRTNGINIGGSLNRLDYFLQQIIFKFNDLELNTESQIINFNGGYNSDDLKLELYNFFKSFNDKWSAGNSIGQRLLFEEFLFLDKANRDIGDKTYINIDRFISMLSPKNDKANLYSAISMLIQGTGFDMRALPAYVNFYGTNLRNKSRVLPSKSVASSIFGTFLEVDYIDSSPKIIIQFTGPQSRRLADLENNKEYRFSDDSFRIYDTNNNPLIITTPEVFTVEDLQKSNKVVAFEVSIGDQNNNMFKGIQLDQSSVKNTSESFVVMENLARSESGTGAYNVDIALFDIYRQVSYSCEITCLGNVMIQPTMYFYLKNVPMFKGSYWITEVSHKIQQNNIYTTFKGSRIPRASLPDPKDSFMSTYRPMLDKIINSARQQVRNALSIQTTEKTIVFNGKSYITNPGSIVINGETEMTSKLKVGLSDFGIPYNGFADEKFIQRVTYNGEEWFRSVVTRMGSVNYPIPDDRVMSLLTNINSVNINPSTLTWGELKRYSGKYLFYSTKFQLTNNITADKIIKAKTLFLNPNKNNLKYQLQPLYQLDRTNNKELEVKGPVNIGPNIQGSGIAMSDRLMKELGIFEGEVIYFKLLE
jgi:hypothetical protein